MARQRDTADIMKPKQLERSIFLALALAGGSLPAAAESYCVACYAPDAVYRCVVANAPAAAAPDPRNQVQCIKQLAKSGGHSRCSVERFSTAGCDGPERIISPSTSVLPITPPPQAAVPAPDANTTAPVNAEIVPQQSDSTAGQPPRTVEELTKSTVESTKKGIEGVTGTVKSTTEQAGEKIEGVGSSIGNAAKKSWNCLSSLFSDC